MLKKFDDDTSMTTVPNINGRNVLTCFSQVSCQTVFWRARQFRVDMRPNSRGSSWTPFPSSWRYVAPCAYDWPACRKTGCGLCFGLVCSSNPPATTKRHAKIYVVMFMEVPYETSVTVMTSETTRC